MNGKLGKAGFLIIILIVIVVVAAFVVLKSGALEDFSFFEKKEVQEGTFIGGEDGLTLSFSSGKPPTEVYQGTKFMIEAKVVNKGEADVLPGELWLKLSNTDIVDLQNEDINNDGVWNRINRESSDTEPNIEKYLDFVSGEYLNLSEIECLENKCEDLNQDGLFFGFTINEVEEGKDYDGDNQYAFIVEKDLNDNGEFDSIVKRNTEILQKAYRSKGVLVPGGVQFFSWPDLQYTREKLTADLPLSFTLTACYPYETKAVSTICIVRDSTRSDVCKPLGKKEIESSGAPIKVIEFEQTANGLIRPGVAVIGFKIKIKKVGEGEIYDVSSSCRDGPELENKNKVAVDEIVIGGYRLARNAREQEQRINYVCGTDVIELDADGEGVLSCSLEYPITNDFSEQFRIRLSYKHVISKNVQVVFKPFKAGVEGEEEEEGQPDLFQIFEQVCEAGEIKPKHRYSAFCTEEDACVDAGRCISSGTITSKGLCCKNVFTPRCSEFMLHCACDNYLCDPQIGWVKADASEATANNLLTPDYYYYKGYLGPGVSEDSKIVERIILSGRRWHICSEQNLNESVKVEAAGRERECVKEGDKYIWKNVKII